MIGIWKVRTLLEEGAQTHQNSRFLRLEKLQSPTGDTTFVCSGKPEDVNRASGVGLMISKKTYEALQNWQPVSDCIISAQSKKYQNYKVLCPYGASR